MAGDSVRYLIRRKGNGPETSRDNAADALFVLDVYQRTYGAENVEAGAVL